MSRAVRRGVDTALLEEVVFHLVEDQRIELAPQLRQRSSGVALLRIICALQIVRQLRTGSIQRLGRAATARWLAVAGTNGPARAASFRGAARWRDGHSRVFKSRTHLRPSLRADLVSPVTPSRRSEMKPTKAIVAGTKACPSRPTTPPRQEHGRVGRHLQETRRVSRPLPAVSRVGGADVCPRAQTTKAHRG
jgi:hypothetical protein